MARKVTYDQEKVKALRASLIDDSLAVFSDDKKNIQKVEKWSEYRKELLLKYAPRVLPTLNEVSGPDGGAINIRDVSDMDDAKLAKLAGYA